MDIGGRLRHAREARGMTLDSLSKSTRVQPRVLSAIEQNDSMSLPPRPYGRGFVRAYASEVGLDPEGTVREFFSQFGMAQGAGSDVRERDRLERSAATGAGVRKAPARTWLWPVGAVLGYVAVAALVIFTGRWAMHSGGEAGAVGTSGTAAAPVAAAERSPAAAPAAPAAGVSVALEAQGPAWVTASVDGRRVVYRTLKPGERVTLDGTREVSVRAGDAGALRWRINGRDAGAMGRSGEVRTARVTRENAGRTK